MHLYMHAVAKAQAMSQKVTIQHSTNIQHEQTGQVCTLSCVIETTGMEFVASSTCM